MMRRSTFSTILFFVVLSLIGLVASRHLDLRLMPSRTSKKVSVYFYWPNATSRTIEQEITSKIESSLSTLQGVKEIESRTNEGGGSVTISLKKAVDLEMFEFQALSVLRRVYRSFPDGVSFPSLKVGGVEKEKPILRVQLIAKSLQNEIYHYVEKHVIPKLGVVEGVQSVILYGKNRMVWNIEYKTDVCDILGVTPQRISQALSMHLKSFQVGVMETKSHYAVQVWLRTKVSPKSTLANIPIEIHKGRQILLGDVADIYRAPVTSRQVVHVDGKQVVSFTVVPEEGVNQLVLERTVLSEIDKLQKELPEDWKFKLTYNAAELLRESLTTMLYRTFLSLLLLFLFVWWVTRSGRYLFYVVVSLFVNISIAIGFYRLFGVEVHMYALAGFTISLGMVIDNTIVMIDHLRYKGGMQVFWAILAATLTTIGALSVIFFQSESVQLILKDFSWVVIIHLALSLVIALYLIPALMDRFPIKTSHSRKRVGRQRIQVRFAGYYKQLLLFLRRYRWASLVLMIWAFGLPVYLLPSSLEENVPMHSLYNKIFQSEWFQENRYSIEKYLGGTFYQFHEAIEQGHRDDKVEETKLILSCENREGGTYEHLKQIAYRVERHLAKYHEIKTFITTLSNPDRFDIEVYFTPKGENSPLPFTVKKDLEVFGVVTGGVNWTVRGVGKAYAKMPETEIPDQVIELHGYEYDQLMKYANDLVLAMKCHERVKKVKVAGETGWMIVKKEGRKLKMDRAKLNERGVQLSQLYRALTKHTRKHRYTIQTPWLKTQQMSLFSDQYNRYDIWSLQHEYIDGDYGYVPLGSVMTMEEGSIVFPVLKKNQQYLLYVNFTFQGSDKTMEKIIGADIQSIQSEMPMGFTVDFKDYNQQWYEEDPVLLWLSIALFIIFVICTVLLESIRQPLSVLMVLPLSFTGVFFMFGTLKLPCDYGGYASFIMLSGIAVNAALYIMNDYNSFKKRYSDRGSLFCFMKAVHYKISPIMLTILSTVLGLIPFLLFQKGEVFWYSFAIGTIGGLLFSVVAIFFILPLFILPKGVSSRR
ncbi:efflux RND transporter permease subunit [Halosquirtibacter laminarini]|uniref:Efflux RND transporter permease subunit n=1 Tax=Halosquirtibacter laminarini TaxID=3374600 RepID=A0AC61NDP3_9BACT|nr:efflux RND transporter permease subunit [Prolixibacteraceae bacterium]